MFMFLEVRLDIPVRYTSMCFIISNKICQVHFESLAFNVLL